MNYYPFHLGDYAAHTAHLEPMEDLAYRRMLDLYYRTEKPLPSNWQETARLIRMKDHGDAIEAVLSEFFVLTEAGWVHARCDAEIARMQDKQAKAKASAQASVNARSTNAQRTLNGSSAKVELPTPTPTPKNTPLPPKGEPEGFAEFYEAYPRKESRKTAEKAFSKVREPLSVLLAALAWQRGRETWTKEGGKFVPLAASWLNGEKWKDERPAPQPGDAPAWHETRAGVERKASALGIGRWNEIEERWTDYRARVMQTAKEKQPSSGFSLDQLSKMAAERTAA